MISCTTLLFDLDGVLADSTASVERHWRAFARKHALDGDAVMRAIHGRRAVDSIRALTPHADVDAELAWLVEGEAHDTSDVVEIRGAGALLAKLPSERWAVVTSGVRQVAEARLRAAQLPIPRILIAADEIERGKPDPQGYLRAAAALGASPSDCVVIEDAPAGAAAARAAGMQLIGLTTTHDAAALDGADLIVPDLASLDVTVGDRIVIRASGG